MKTRIARLALVFTLLIAAAAAQQVSPALHPPKGSKIAIVVFEDLQCPACAASDPTLQDAVKAYHIPLVRRDYLIPGHSWSPRAHLIAYWFEQKSPALAEQFRQWVFANQARIYPGNFQQKVNEFARAHGQQLPANVDPNGALQAKINANIKMGGDLGIHQTPSIYVVGEQRNGSITYLPVDDRNKLFQTIDEIKARVNSAAPAAKASGRKK